MQKGEVIILRISKEDLKLINQGALKDRRSRSAFIRRASIRAAMRVLNAKSS